MSTIRVFAPASVSNVTCGFDILGFALEDLGDEVTARVVEEPGVVVESISGDDGRLPRDARLNTASIAAQAVVDRLSQEGCGLAISIAKNMPISSGLGSSAASAVAATLAADAALGGSLDREDLLLCALEGERAASGAIHADNVAPSMLGGLVLVRSAQPPDLVSLPIPEGLSCALLLPRIEIRTHEARALLGDSIPLETAVKQWGNVAGLIAGLYEGDWGLLRRSLVDVVAEPVRAPLVPGFEGVKTAAIEAGALGCSLSGSGPAIFALCQGRELAESVSEAMHRTFEEQVGIDSTSLVSAVGAPGARIVSD